MAGDEIYLMDPEEDIAELLQDPKILKVFHNAKFDIQFLKNETLNIWDTYLAERILTAGRVSLGDLSLEKVAKKYTGIDLDKTLQTSFVPGQKLTEEQIEYAVMDVKVLKPIFQAQKKKVLSEGLKDTAILEFEVAAITAGIELNGMAVDLEKLEVLKVTIGSKLAVLEEELKKLAGNDEINFRSPVQVREVLADLGHQVDSTAEKVLKKIDHQFAAKLLEHRKLAKLLSSFVNKLPSHVHDKTGRIHPEFHQLGTVTGRYTCSKPNLQQIPKEQEWRDLFVAPLGRKLITADYNQIELRIVAELSKDPAFLEAYQNGEDLHQITADEVGISRDAAKAINFGLCYGMGPAGLAEKLGISRSEAGQYINRYFGAYAQVKQALDQLGFEAVRTGYSVTPLGRKRYYPPVAGYDFSGHKSLERKGRNTPIQSTCGDILKQALRNLKIYPELKIINLIHDEIVFEVAEEEANLEATQRIKGAMVRAGERFLKEVPVVVDVAIDDVWRK
jgi:DNA polymerase-1